MLEHPSAGVWDYVAAVPDPEGRGRGATSLLYWVEVTVQDSGRNQCQESSRSCKEAS